MPSLRKYVRNSPLYDLVVLRRAMRAAREWTPQDEAMKAFYSQFIREGAVCFDVGANVGSRSKVFLASGAKVVAVEPQAWCGVILRAAYGRRDRFTLVRKALGPSEGVAEMVISNARNLSSLSKEWIGAVQETGRFPGCTWNKVRNVGVTTLDVLIDRYGVPSFIKIDVEGFEHEVLKGLSRPVEAISFEFTPEFLDSAERCVGHLETLGSCRFNYSIGESMRMALPDWTTAPELVKRLRGHRSDTELFGDVYAQFV